MRLNADAAAGKVLFIAHPTQSGSPAVRIKTRVSKFVPNGIYISLPFLIPAELIDCKKKPLPPFLPEPRFFWKFQDFCYFRSKPKSRIMRTQATQSLVILH